MIRTEYVIATSAVQRALLPKIAVCDGGSKAMGAIFRALDRAYTDGIEDALELSPDQQEIERRKAASRVPRKKESVTGQGGK